MDGGEECSAAAGLLLRQPGQQSSRVLGCWVLGVGCWALFGEGDVSVRYGNTGKYDDDDNDDDIVIVGKGDGY